MTPVHARQAHEVVSPPLHDAARGGVARALVPLAWGACTVALTYATARVLQVLLLPAVDPRTAPMPVRIPFFSRLEVALLCAVCTSLGAALLRARDPARFDRALPSLIVWTTILTIPTSGSATAATARAACTSSTRSAAATSTATRRPR